MARRPQGETKGMDSQHAGLWEPVGTLAARGEAEDVFRPPQDAARPHARCSLRVEGGTAEIQT